MIGKYKIAVVVAYFGKLPNWFDAWRISAIHNENIDFLFFTDNNKVEQADNIIVHYMSFPKFRENIQKKFDFKIVLDQPYKICDYRPSWGYVLADYLKGYDFWGYCDIDLVFGRIDHFVTENILHEYPHIHQIGHFSLYRNDESMNTLFMNSGNYPEYNYTEAYTTSDSCYFDEFYGMECKFKRNNIRMYDFVKKFVSIPPTDNAFYFRKEQIIGRWRDGQLYIEYKSGKLEEMLYFHIMRRDMKMENNVVDNHKCFVIVPGVIFSDCQEPSMKLFEYISGNKIICNLAWRLKRYRKQLRRYGIIKLLVLRNRGGKIQKYIETLNEHYNV